MVEEARRQHKLIRLQKKANAMQAQQLRQPDYQVRTVHYGVRSEGGQFWWNGYRWMPVPPAELQPPAQGQRLRSPDGH